ncbi:hypothetical protein [Streptomyces sp. NPDC126514]|uniref:hypothetical protein n=1 Tax=Streptomyces sp. NPDC126514 TaxID=3155210 RepID=UPI00332494A3
MEIQYQEPDSCLKALHTACTQWAGYNTAERDRTFLTLVQNALAEQPDLRALPSGGTWTFTDLAQALENESKQAGGGGGGIILDEAPVTPAADGWADLVTMSASLANLIPETDFVFDPATGRFWKSDYSAYVDDEGVEHPAAGLADAGATSYAAPVMQGGSVYPGLAEAENLRAQLVGLFADSDPAIAAQAPDLVDVLIVNAIRGSS